MLACVSALVALKATHCSAAIASAKAGLGFQYHAKVEAELIQLTYLFRRSSIYFSRHCYSKVDQNVAQLVKRVAELESRIRHLEEKK